MAMFYEDAGQFEGGELILPNGLIIDGRWVRNVEMRESDGREEDLLTNKAYAREGTSLTKVFQNVITKIGDITDRGRLHTLVPKLSLEDATFLVARLRQLSLGDTVSFKARCPVASCKKESAQKFSLSQQPCSSRSESDSFQESFSVSLPGGLEVSYGLVPLARNPELVSAKRDNPDKLQTIALYFNVLEVNGKPTTLGAVSLWSSRVRAAFRAAVDSQQFGLDPRVEVTCPACDAEFEISLPIADPGFFFPSGTPK